MHINYSGLQLDSKTKEREISLADSRGTVPAAKTKKVIKKCELASQICSHYVRGICAKLIAREPPPPTPIPPLRRGVDEDFIWR